MSDTEDQQPQEVAEVDVEEETALVNKELTVEIQGTSITGNLY